MPRQAVPDAAGERPPPSAEGSFDHDRYRIHQLLGRGGMALVYEATDLGTQTRVALKLLAAQADAARKRRHLELFEREFHTLSELAHPRIVRVFDFGVVPAGAFYTMELLAGGDLHDIAPVPWQRACAIARDVCSALSFLHSRRFVHRDVSPRNVRCAAEGPAKLIDFGALATVGPTKLLVGTPPCCPPESLHMQTLDGRADLFGLGASLYYLLVGKHAYPARGFASLDSVWRGGFDRPSDVVPGIPAELDTLVIDLLRLDPDARPASAAEVMERLSSIDGQSACDPETAAAAYLATPSLIGRNHDLARVRRRLTRSTSGRSRSVVIEGSEGIGRTRFLDACLLEATLAGQLVVRVDADDAVSGDYGAARALARQLLLLIPQLAREHAAPRLERLVSVIPELNESGRGNENGPVSDVHQLVPRAQVQRALHDWLVALSRQQPIVLAVDDFHRIDEPSAALIALLGQDSDEHELCVLITVDPAARWTTAESARNLLQPLTTLRLAPLDDEESQQLLSAVFGPVPHVEVLAEQARELCSGRPGHWLALAQHLVDRGVVRYAAGAWTLPAALDVRDLPVSLSDALAARITRLPDDARELACAFALCPDRGFSFRECGALSATRDPAQRVRQLDALMSADLVRSIGDEMKLSQRSWVPLLRATLPTERALILERRLAELFEARPGHEFRAAAHWLRSGEAGRALDRLVEHVTLTQARLVQGPEVFSRYLLSLPDGWFETFHHGLALCERLGRPRRDRYLILRRMLAIMALLDTHATDLLSAIFSELRRDSGYDAWLALAQVDDPGQRLTAALGEAKTRFDALPDHERVLDPAAAIRDLAQAIVAAMGPIANALELTTLRTLPQLLPFTSLSPALEASRRLVEGVDARLSGRVRQSRRIYTDLLALLQQPDRGGLDATYATYLELSVMSALGLMEAGLGLRSCLQWAERIAEYPTHEVYATVIRMLDAYFQGDVVAAEQHRRTADRLRLQNNGRQMLEGVYLIWEIQAHAMCGDLTRVRHTMDAIAPLAARHAGWVPVLHFATAEYHRMARDFERAVEECQRAFAIIGVGEHQIWMHVAACHVLSLLELGASQRALSAAIGAAQASERVLGYVPDPLQHALGLSRASMRMPDAAPPVDAVITRLKEQAISGLRLTVAYETRARIALYLEDMDGFAHFAELCRQSCFAHRNPALVAKHHRLLQEGRQLIAGDASGGARVHDLATISGMSPIELALSGCRDDAQRARLSLTLLTQQSGAQAGMLFVLGDHGPVCAAKVGPVSEAPDLTERVREYLVAQQEDSDATATQTGSAELVPDAHALRDGEGRAWRPILLSHHESRGLAITGVALLMAASEAQFVHPGPMAAALGEYYASKGATSLLLFGD
ncbi:MAG: protein kinase [Polyangiales bacterium]